MTMELAEKSPSSPLSWSIVMLFDLCVAASHRSAVGLAFIQLNHGGSPIQLPSFYRWSKVVASAQRPLPGSERGSHGRRAHLQPLIFCIGGGGVAAQKPRLCSSDKKTGVESDCLRGSVEWTLIPLLRQTSSVIADITWGRARTVGEVLVRSCFCRHRPTFLWNDWKKF